MPLMEKNVNNRQWLINRLKAEVVGPDPASGNDVIEINDAGDISLTKDQFYHPKKQQMVMKYSGRMLLLNGMGQEFFSLAG